MWMRALFFFSVYVCSNAAACVCKMVQTLVFPDQLVNHIWGKNLDSFSPSFSAAFPFPPCVFPSLLLHSSEEEKKNNKKKRSQLRSFFFCLVSSGKLQPGFRAEKRNVLFCTDHSSVCAAPLQICHKDGISNEG